MSRKNGALVVFKIVNAPPVDKLTDFWQMLRLICLIVDNFDIIRSTVTKQVRLWYWKY